MDSRNDIREFLTSRRDRLSPEQAGLPDFGGRRRVKGLRREEVALLAGMSTEYYTRLERGNASGVSEAVLDGISRALQLDEAEHAHLYDLARTANEGVHPRRTRGSAKAETVRPAVQLMIDAMTDLPVMVQNGRLDYIAFNRLGTAMYSELLVAPHRPPNAGRFVFLDPRAKTFFRDYREAAEQTVALLRSEAGRSPYDRVLSDLVGELSTRSDDFRRMWGSHEVRIHQTGAKAIHHPVVGDLDLTYEAMSLSSDRGLQMVVYNAAPGTPSADGLRMLAAWVATNDVERGTSLPTAPIADDL